MKKKSAREAAPAKPAPPSELVVRRIFPERPLVAVRWEGDHLVEIPFFRADDLDGIEAWIDRNRAQPQRKKEIVSTARVNCASRLTVRP